MGWAPQVSQRSSNFQYSNGQNLHFPQLSETVKEKLKNSTTILSVLNYNIGEATGKHSCLLIIDGVTSVKLKTELFIVWKASVI